MTRQSSGVTASSGYCRRMADDRTGPVLGEQIAYYRTVAEQYLDGALDRPGGDELEAALNVFPPRGEVLELACGPGTWTSQLLRYAEQVTAVDAAPEVLTLTRAHARRRPCWRRGPRQVRAGRRIRVGTSGRAELTIRGSGRIKPARVAAA